MCEVGITLCTLNNFVLIGVALSVGCVGSCGILLSRGGFGIGGNVTLDFLTALLGCCQCVAAALQIGVFADIGIVLCCALVSINPMATAVDVLHAFLG